MYARAPLLPLNAGLVEEHQTVGAVYIRPKRSGQLKFVGTISICT
jgi:hypothetical protein